MSTQKMKIKTGDTVQVLRGKNAGKSGKVTQVLRDREMVVVDGVNTMVKHLRSQRSGEKGQRIEFFGPLHVSKVALLCPKCNKPTRIGYSTTTGEDGTTQKSRQCKKCNETFA
jgi:large subunit ribosomal protein L24